MIIRPTYSLINASDAVPPFGAGERVHFLHVEKCGGTTMRYVLEGLAAQRGLKSINEARQVGGALPDPGGGDIAMGHFPPADQFQRTDTRYFTVLRTPQDRLISAILTHTRKRGLSIGDMIAAVDEDFANAATVLLAGPGPDDFGSRFDRARTTLERRLAFFGFQERFDEAMALLGGLLGVAGIIFPVFQLTRESHKELVTLDDRLRALCRHDDALFDFATTLYADRFATRLREAELRQRHLGRPYLSIRLTPEMGDAVDVSEIVFTDTASDPATN